jgi:hypothetical protein
MAATEIKKEKKDKGSQPSAVGQRYTYMEWLYEGVLSPI